MASLKVAIEDSAKDFVRKTAEKKNTSEVDIVRKALSAYRFLQNVEELDGEVIIRRKDGRFHMLTNL